jgi:TPR repeat protein
MTRVLGVLLLVAWVGGAWAASAAELAREAMGGNPASTEKLRALAESGDAIAQHYMGQLYLSGRVVPRSDEQAAQWFRRAADAGDLASAHNLGVIHERATGPLRDRAEALKWYRSAAERGFARSQANLGYLLWQAKDPEARMWIEKAAAQKEPRGLHLLGMLELDAGREAEAVARLEEAARADDRDAQYQLALLHGAGRGTAKDDKRAMDWLRKSAERNQPEAQYRLAAAYARGLYGVRQDDAAAAAWLRRSARQGNVEAQYALANAYAEGRGVPRDANEALGWIQLAARNNHPEAAAALERIQAMLKKPAPANP